MAQRLAEHRAPLPSFFRTLCPRGFILFVFNLLLAAWSRGQNLDTDWAAQRACEQLSGSRWEGPLDGAWLDPTPGRGDAWSLVGPAGEERFAVVRVGLFRGDLTFRCRLAARGGGYLRVALHADATLSRGVLVSLGDGPGRSVRVILLTEGKRRVLAEAPAPPGVSGPEPKPLEVRLVGAILHVRWGEEPVFGRRGVSVPTLREGRVLLGAGRGDVTVLDARLRGNLTAISAQNLRICAEAVLPTLARRKLPGGGPLDHVGAAELSRGLEDPARADLLEVRAVLASRYAKEVFTRAEDLARRFPAAPGPAFVTGAARVLHLADGAGARGSLARGLELPGATSLLGDAHLLVGDLDAADAAYARAVEPHDGRTGRALIQWLRGNRSEARALLANVDTTPCRRCRQRQAVLEDLIALQSWPPLSRAAAGDVEVLSDGGGHVAGRVLRQAQAFLNSLGSTGLSLDAKRPVTVLACVSPRVFELWNDRFGGSRFAETDGIYRPGTGLLVVRYDDDDDVTRRRLQHELVHHAVHGQAWVLPRLFEEGLAEYLGSGTPRGTRLMGLEHVAPDRFATVLADARADALEAPVDVLLREEVRFGARGQSDYAQSWAAIHVLGEEKLLPVAMAVVMAGEVAASRAWLSEHLSPEKVTLHVRRLAGDTPPR